MCAASFSVMTVTVSFTRASVTASGGVIGRRANLAGEAS